MKTDVTTLDAGAAGDIELADAIFRVAPRADRLHRVLRWRRARTPAGPPQAKSRGETAHRTKRIATDLSKPACRTGRPGGGQFGH